MEEFAESDENLPEEEGYGSDFPSEPLYANSPITVAESSALIMQFKMRHHLSNECLSDLLHLLKLHCPTPNKCIKSLKFTYLTNNFVHYLIQ